MQRNYSMTPDKLMDIKPYFPLALRFPAGMDMATATEVWERMMKQGDSGAGYMLGDGWAKLKQDEQGVYLEVTLRS